ncbi:unnamed protein product [Discula destructiva]
MPSFVSSLAAAGAFAAQAYAHGLVTGFNTDGTYNQGYILDYYYAKINTGTYPATAGWYEEATDSGFVAASSFAEPDIICHKNADNADSITASVSAGGTVDFMWNTWPDTHIGPVLTYVAACGASCATVDKTTLEWVKIDEAGIDLGTQTWPTDALIANNFTYSITVPSTLASGDYVFRHEIIALHSAGSEGGAQAYPFCINIAITGGGTDTPAGTLGTALYKTTDPGILFNAYTDITEYIIPGPALYTGGTGSTGASESSGSPPEATEPPASSATPTPTSGGSPSASATGTGGSNATPTGSPSGATPSGSATSGYPAAPAPSDDEDDEYSECLQKARRRRRHAKDLQRRMA